MSSSERVTYATLAAGESGDFRHKFDRALEEAQRGFGATHPHHIGGRDIPGEDTFEDRAPADTRIVLGRFPLGTPAEMDRAVTAAAEAFPAWRSRPWQERLALLRKAADLIEERRFPLSALVSVEVGKNRLESMGDVTETADLVRYYCEQVERHSGFEKAMGRLNPREETLSVLRPYGVWGVISPFNFPAALSIGPAAGALAGGNTVVLKPSQEAPLSAAELYRCFVEAGLPAGVLNVVQGPAATGRALTAHAGLQGLVFTGSKAVGMDLVRTFSREYPKPCIVEMGGKNPALVMPSADLDEAAEGILRSAFGLQGQKCSACSRVYVHKDVKDRFTDLLVEKTAALAIGDPAKDGIYLGPVIHDAAFHRYGKAAEAARRDGRVLAGGGSLRKGALAHGYFVAPTIVDGLPRDHSLLREELFLPFVCLAPVSSLREAIGEANRTEYGLTAGLFSKEPEEIESFLEGIEAGVVYVNRRAGATTGAWPGVQPFGGWKGSGSSGKAAGGLYYVQQFLREQSQTLLG
jgi:1-pyrroline-5-carboxylate dehydrogenase